MAGSGAERAGGAAGLGALLVGAAAEVFERGVSRDSGPAAVAAHFHDQAAAIQAQTLLFVLGAALQLWFLAALRTRLRRTEGGDGTLAVLALVAGAAGTTLTLVALAVQEALTLEPATPALAAVVDSCFLLANLPVAVLLVAVAALTFTRRAFPVWIGWLSAVAAVTQVVPLMGLVAGAGPLAPGGWLSAFLPYPLYVVWLGAVSVAMLLPASRRRGAPVEPALASR